MAYFLNLSSPETYEVFSRSDRTLSGFRRRHWNMAQRIAPGDKFICYMTKLSRWIGLLEILEGPFIDETPIYAQEDPYVVRFRVRELVWLPVEKAVPIHEKSVWDSLSFTRGQPKGSSSWTGKLRGSLVQLDEADGRFLESLIGLQRDGGTTYPVDADVYKRLTTHRVRREDKDVMVTVPEGSDSEDAVEPRPEPRESLRMQALLAEIGARMSMKIWLPRADRSNVLPEWQGDHSALLDRLPLNYDETTLKTIEQIDVLWLKGRANTRAFEVEHTTSIYSGILRMADLLALQPNMDIRLHIVAPYSRRDKVFQEIRRPVFSLLERGPLSESCTYLSYESVRELAAQPHLAHLSDSVLEEYVDEGDQ